MPFWVPELLRSATAGSWFIRPPQIELPKDRPAELPLPPLHAPITGLSTDSRAITPGQVFLALRGERFDGHRFLAEAAAAGAPVLIVDDIAGIPLDGYRPAVGVLRVADTGKALLRLAAAYRKTLDRTRVIAVCGSNGKTTTAGLIRQVLTGCGLRGSASPKSFNNAIGVPLTILSAQPTDQFLVCEIGTNAPGEIAALAEIASPDIAVLTSIGREHLEGLGDLAGVAREEASVFKFLRSPPKGCAIVTADAPELAEHLKTVRTVVSFGRNDGATLRLSAVRHVFDGDFAGLEFTVNDRQVCRVGLLGEHNALNALAALAVAKRMGLDDQKAVAALAKADGPEMRLQRTTMGGVEVLNDAYNANPDSMIAGLRTLVAIAKERAAPPQGGRTVAILADMLELGGATADGHRAVAHALLDLASDGGNPRLDLAVFCGPSMAEAHRVLVGAGWSPSAAVWLPQFDEAAAARVGAMLRPGDLVLLKGSRRMRLERVLGALAPAGFCGAGSVAGLNVHGVAEPKPPVLLAG